MTLTTPARFNSELREKAIKAARMGMSLEGVAHLCGISRQTLWTYRKADEGFNSALLSALAEFEFDLCQAQLDGCRDIGALPAAQLSSKVLAQRFPQRHGVDPRLRLDARQAQEGYAEDLDDPTLNPATETAGNVLGRLVDAMLKQDETPE